MNLSLVLPPNVLVRKPVGEMLIKIFIMFWDLLSDQVAAWTLSFFGLTIKTSDQLIMHRHFPWPVVLKVLGIVSIADSFGNHAPNFSVVLPRSRIHVLNILEQWVKVIENISARSSFKSLRRSLINSSKNSSTDCNSYFYALLISSDLLISVLVILFIPRRYAISLVL